MHEPVFPELEPEKAFLVAAMVRGSRPLLSMEDSLNELALLADTAGMEVVGQATQSVHNIDPATFVGSGKLVEICAEVIELGAQVVVFDDELSPRHQREIEKRLGENFKVIDRSALILDIFAQHASTREGSLQVELAQYEYRLPRLTRQWTHLARQAGGSGSKSGVGLRGPGETQLEVDRREISRKISKLKEELEAVRMHRNRHRAQRDRSGIPIVALVGYTNAGKSTLLNALANANVYVADQLFATLDPTTRRIQLPSSRNALFTDTVGFIQKLPTTLIAAFRATLEEIREADLILHIVDVSHPNVVQHIEVVEDTLAEIDVPAVPRLLVYNKIDAVNGVLPDEVTQVRGYDGYSSVSAAQKTGLDELLTLIETSLASVMGKQTLLLPYERGDLVSQLYGQATVTDRQNTPEGVRLVVQLPPEIAEHYKKYEV